MAWACVCSNSSSLMGLVVGMWNRDIMTTLLHSLRTIPMAEILSSLVSRELNVKSSYWLSNGYSGMSTLQPENKKAVYTSRSTKQNLTLCYFFNNRTITNVLMIYINNLHKVVTISYILQICSLILRCLPFSGTTTFASSGWVTKPKVKGSLSTVLSKMMRFMDRQKSMLTSFSSTCR